MKKTLSIFLALLMLCSLGAAAASALTEYKDTRIEYSVTEAGTVTVYNPNDGNTYVAVLTSEALAETLISYSYMLPDGFADYTLIPGAEILGDEMTFDTCFVDTETTEALVPDTPYTLALFRINADNKIIGYSLTTVTIISNQPDPDNSEYLGDVNIDGEVNIKDATLIQKFLASSVELSEFQKALADVNEDEKVNVKDATAVQKHTAGIDTGCDFAKRISYLPYL